MIKGCPPDSPAKAVCAPTTPLLEVCINNAACALCSWSLRGSDATKHLRHRRALKQTIALHGPRGCSGEDANGLFLRARARERACFFISDFKRPNDRKFGFRGLNNIEGDRGRRHHRARARPRGLANTLARSLFLRRHAPVGACVFLKAAPKGRKVGGLTFGASTISRETLAADTLAPRQGRRGLVNTLSRSLFCVGTHPWARALFF